VYISAVMQKTILSALIILMSITFLVNRFHHEIADVWHTLTHVIQSENHHHHHATENSTNNELVNHHEHRLINQFLAQFDINNGSASENSTFLVEQTNHKFCQKFSFHLKDGFYHKKSNFTPFRQSFKEIFISPLALPPNAFPQV
jgi:hypothetical protein